MIVASRQKDEIVLLWIRLRRLGWGPTRIAKASAVTVQRVSSDTNWVRDADVEESGEPAGAVRGYYW